MSVAIQLPKLVVSGEFANTFSISKSIIFTLTHIELFPTRLEGEFTSTYAN